MDCDVGDEDAIIPDMATAASSPAFLTRNRPAATKVVWTFDTVSVGVASLHFVLEVGLELAMLGLLELALPSACMPS